MNAYKTILPLLHCSVVLLLATHVYAVLIDGRAHRCKSQLSALELATQIG